MIETLQKLLPIFIAFLAAYLVKRRKILHSSDGETLLKVTFYITIPALVFVSVVHAHLSFHYLIFLLLPALLLVPTYIVSRAVLRHSSARAAERGILLAAPMVINSGFALSFLLAVFGGEGLTRVVLFNMAYNPLLLIWVYAIAASHNPDAPGSRAIAKKVLASPPLWALCAGLAVNLPHLTIPGSLNDALYAVGNLTSVLIVIGLGLLFAPRRDHFFGALSIIWRRMLLGLGIGIALVLLFHLRGVDRAAVLLLAAAPVGFNMLNFAAIENLDKELAASTVSYASAAFLVLAPVILLLVG